MNPGLSVIYWGLMAPMMGGPEPPAVTVIEDVRLEVGDGTTRNRTTVVFGPSGIISVGTGRGPANARRIQGRGKILTPGFTESLTQIGLVEVGLESSTVDHRLDLDTVTPAFRAADGFNPRSIRIPIPRTQGVTSAVVSPRGTLLYGLGDWVELSGDLRSEGSSPPAAMFGGITASDRAASGARGGVWLRLREVLADARAYRRAQTSYQQNRLRSLSLSRPDLEALQPVIKGALPLVFYADRASDILTAVEFARREKIRVVIAGGAEAWQVAPQLASASVPVILKPTRWGPRSFDQLHTRLDAAARLHQARVKLILSTLSWQNRIGRLRQEAGIAVAHGLPHSVAIQTLTQHPAQVFGRDAAVGTVKIGKRANLVLWSGDPFELTSVVEGIWIRGRTASLNDRQRRLAEKHRPKRGQKL